MASRDLDEVFAYGGTRAGPDIADRLIDAITERFWILGEYPDAGRVCDDIAPGVKCFPAGKYLIGKNTPVAALGSAATVHLQSLGRNLRC